MVFAAISGAALLCGWLVGLTWETAFSPWISQACYVAAYFFGSYFIVFEAIAKIRRGAFEIDFLMIVAAIGAAILGAWAEGALLLFLFSLGHALEHYAMGRARHAIESSGRIWLPETATVRRQGREFEIATEDLEVGDTVIIKPNDRVPADGWVIRGTSSVDQAAITGESIPVDKEPVGDLRWALEHPLKLKAEHRVFAGTINKNGALEVRVTQLASQSTLARIIQLVNEAESQHSPTQQLTKKFEKYYVPLVIAFVVLLNFVWLVVDEPFSESFYRAMAVLVAASPCALAIATPSAVLSGVARAARGGVLVKGGAPLENLGRLEVIAFDKTGTLTEGRPKLTDVIAYQATEQELLNCVVSVERLSDHPLAAAIVRDGNHRLDGNEVPVASGLQSNTGRGVSASLGGQMVWAGKSVWFSELDGPAVPQDLLADVTRLERQGRTTVVVRRANQYLGVIGLMDTPRESVRETLTQLRELGIKRMVMLSGDNQIVADAVAGEIGIDEVFGNLMPADKVTAIQNLDAAGGVAMVGDGVNDAPALAQATVGIAMGAAGSDIALETADVALMADDLSHLPFAVGLSRRTSRTIAQNLWLSLGMVAVLIPATLFGLELGFAVLFHEGSTVFVVFNALCLLAYQPSQQAD